MNIQCYTQGEKIADATKRYVEERINALDKYAVHITNARVEILRGTHHKKGNVFHVHVLLSVPGGKLQATESSTTIEEGIDIVRDELERQLRQRKEKFLTRRRVTGQIRRLLKAFPLKRD